MDTSLWDSSYYQDYSTPQQSNHCNECHLLSDFCLCFHRDVIEEDALNVKSYLQVLDKLTDKADEEIKKLEEDILMLQCQLAWDDEDWSKTCSAAVNEKIDHLNGLIQSLKGESEEYMHNPDFPSELFQSLHDLLKPLFENYLVKSKQRDSNVTQVPIIPTVVCNSEKPKAKDDKNIEEKKCTTTLKISGRKESKQLEKSKSNNLQQVHPIANDLTVSIPMAKDLTVSVPMEKDLTVSIPMAKDLTVSIPIKEANASKREETSNKDKGAISEAKDTQHELRQENEVTILHLQSPETEKQVSGIVKVDSMKQRTETPRKVRKKANGPNTKVVVSRMPPVNIRNEVTTIGTGREHHVGAFDERAKHAREMEMNISSEVTTFSGTTIGTGREHPVGAFAEQAKYAREMEMNLEHQTPVQQRQIETLRLKSDERAKHARELEMNLEHQTQVHQRQIETLRPNSNSLIIYEHQGSQKKLKAAPQNDQNLFWVKITEVVESSTEIVKDISKMGKGGTEHQPDANNIAFSSTSSMESPPGSQPIMKEARGVFNKLTVNELKAIAKERGLRGYSKHTKAAMLELLANEPPSKE